MVRELLLRARGFSIAAKAWGSEAGRPLLAVHGWQDNANSWITLGPKLADLGYHVIGIDLPGHGRSEHRAPYAPYSAAEYTLQVGQLLQELGWAPDGGRGTVTLVGHSMGAGICAALAGALGPRIRRLVMIEALGIFPREADTAPDSLLQSLEQDVVLAGKRPRRYPTLRKAAEARIATAGTAPGSQTLSMEAALALCRRGTMPAALFESRLERTGHYGPVPEELDPLRWRPQHEAEDGDAAAAEDPDAPREVLFRHDLRMRAASPIYYTEEHCRAFLRRVEAPTLVAIADNGWPAPTDAYAGRAQCIRNLEYHTLRHASHHPHMDPGSAARVAELVCAFLAKDGGDTDSSAPEPTARL